MRKYWLMKNEPESYSIDDLERDGRTHWEGVRNFQARNLIRDELKVGDGVLFYHSGVNPPGVVGIAKIVRAAYPDFTAQDRRSPYYDPRSSKDDPRWYMVDIEFVEKFQRLVSLKDLANTKGLENLLVTKRSRLSVQPVSKKEFEIIRKLGYKKA